jgi:hypothetical protein
MFKKCIPNFLSVMLFLFPFAVTSSIAMQANEGEVDCHAIYQQYCTLCDNPEVEEYNDECDTLALNWYNHCRMYGDSPNCKVPLPPKMGMGKKDPDLEFLQHYYGKGNGEKIYKQKEHFLELTKRIDEALHAYQERMEHDLLSDSKFVIETAEAVTHIANLAAEVFWNDTTSYQFTQYINEMLYPIYMQIYARHFPDLYGLQQTVKEPQQMFESIMHDIDHVAGENHTLKEKMAAPVECGFHMAQSMATKGQKGMFSFVTGSEILFPLIQLYFDSWELAKFNGEEAEVFTMHEQACSHGTGIRAFIYFFAPQLAKALEKKLSQHKI